MELTTDCCAVLLLSMLVQLFELNRKYDNEKLIIARGGTFFKEATTAFSESTWTIVTSIDLNYHEADSNLFFYWKFLLSYL